MSERIKGENLDSRWKFVECVPKKPTKYRYLLKAQLDKETGKSMAVIQKNPSRACSQQSDPTVGKVLSWASDSRHQYPTVAFLNLFALRSPKPNYQINENSVGLQNKKYIENRMKDVDVVVVAWGNPNGLDKESYDRRIGKVLESIDKNKLHRVGGLTKEGYPRHGFSWKKNFGLEKFS
ncbi:MAG: DUF1643 domain-containing protein [Nitrososphaerales archaeon]